MSNTGTNTPTNVTYVGTDAKVGSIWSDARVELRDRVTIYGTAKAPKFTLGNQVVVQGGKSTVPRGPKLELLAPFAGLPDRQMTPIVIESGQDTGLQPGKYGDLTVRARGVLRLDPEAYSFSTLIVEQGGKVITKSQCEPVMVQVRTGLTFRGTALEDGGDDAGIGLVIRYDGTQTAHVEQPFRGNIAAPFAELVLSAHAHLGAFFARKLRVQSGASITQVAPWTAGAGECGVGLEVASPPTLTDIGAAPELSGPGDLDTFLAWYYKITVHEQVAAEARINAVLPNSGIRDEVIQRFATARREENLGHALMLLSLLGALADAKVSPFLVDLVEQPISETEFPNSEATTPFDLEVAYRRQALYILQTKGSQEAQAAVKAVALEHPVGQLRKAAIRTIIRGQSSEVVEELRAQIRPEDEFYLDLPDRSDPEFAAKLEAFRQKYSNN